MSRHIKVLTGLSFLALALVAATVLVDVWVDDREPAAVLCARWTYAGIALPLTVLGAFVAASRPGNVMAYLMMVAGLAVAADQAVWSVAHADPALSIPGAAVAAWLANVAWIVPPACLLLALLIYPDGRLPSPRWRIALHLCLAWGGLSLICAALAGGPYGGPAVGGSPLLPGPVGDTLALWSRHLFTAFPGLLLLGCAAATSRYRRARGVSRAQLRCLALAACVVALVWALPDAREVGSWTRVAANGAIWLVPAAIFVAVMSYRLYAIDLLLSRALAAGLVAVTVTVAYLAATALVGGAVGAVVRIGVLPVLVTAVTALLLSPLRSRALRVVERRLYGVRTDPYAVVDRLATQLTAVRTEERGRLRSDLHDGLGPLLAGIAYQVSALGRLLRGASPPAGALLGELADDVRTSLIEMRRLIDGLAPAALDDRGLAEAAARLVSAVSTGSDVRIVVPSDLPPLRPEVAAAAYRVLGEALTNVVRHAHAAGCLVALWADPDALWVKVSDDGIGITLGPAPGVGLASMRARCAALGGDLRVEARPGGGIVLTARLPLS